MFVGPWSIFITFANVVGRMLCIHPCLSVCLSVCLLAGLLKKLWTDLNKIVREGSQLLFLRAPYVDQERSESLCGETHNGKCWHQHTIVWPQQWKVLTSACHCLTHNNGKCWRQHAIVWCTTMESADVSMPLFDAQQWKCKSLSTQKCKSLSTQSLFIRAPYVDQKRSEPLCGECP